MGLTKGIIRVCRDMLAIALLATAPAAMAQTAQEPIGFEDPVDSLRRTLETRSEQPTAPIRQAPLIVPEPRENPARLAEPLPEPEPMQASVTAPGDDFADALREQVDRAARFGENGLTRGVRAVETEAGRASDALSIPAWAILLAAVLTVFTLASLVIWLLFRPKNAGPTRFHVARDAAEENAEIDPDTMLSDMDDAAMETDEEDQPARPATARVAAQKPDAWARPNLDRLRASIKEDWQAARADIRTGAGENAAARPTSALSGRLATLQKGAATPAAISAGAMTANGAHALVDAADDDSFWDDIPERKKDRNADEDDFDIVDFLDEFDGDDDAVTAHTPYEHNIAHRSPEEILARIRAMSEAR